jgi:hypothetical protein
MMDLLHWGKKRSRSSVRMSIGSTSDRKWEDRIRSASERGMVDIIKLFAIYLSYNLKNITSIISAAFMTAA